jgi:hypothetical protein
MMIIMMMNNDNDNGNDNDNNIVKVMVTVIVIARMALADPGGAVRVAVPGLVEGGSCFPHIFMFRAYHYIMILYTISLCNDIVYNTIM